MRARLRTWLLLLPLTLTLPLNVFAQANNVRLGGTVVDPSGAVLPGVRISLRSLRTNQTSETTTGAEGRFSFSELPIGEYEISATVDGFSKLTRSDLNLLTGQVLDLTLTMQIGDVSSVVEVTGEAPLVQTADSTVQTAMTQRQVQELPLNGRNPLQLVALTAGATVTDAGTVAGQQDNRGLSVNGLRSTQNNFRLDGSNYNNRFFGSAPVLPNPDTLEEFNVQSANYSARTSGAGALVELSTRSGTNEFHGSVFEFLRNTVLNANNFFINARPLTAAEVQRGVTKQPRPPFKLNQYGGTIGGPIVKDKAFFFFSYQGTRQRSAPGSVTVQSLTTAQRNGDLSSITTPIIDPLTGTQFVTNGVRNVIPANRLDPVVRQVLDAYLPPPNSGNNLVVLQNRDSDDEQYTGKFNYVFSENNYLTARYYDDTNDFQRPFAAPNGFFAANNFKNRTFSVRDTHNFGNNLTATFSGAYSKFRRIQEPQAPGLRTLQDFGVNAAQSIETDFFPGVRFIATPAFQLFSGGGLEQTPTTWDFHAAAVYTRGAHTLQLGSDFQFDKVFTLDASFTPGTWTFNGQRSGALLADVLLGLPSQFQQDSGRTNDLRESKYHFWVQDDWKVRQRLTLNLGLRWEPKLPPIDKLNNLVAFVAGRQSQIAPDAPRGLLYPGDEGIGDEVFPRDYNNFAPRVGFAYDAFGTGRTVLRGGYGVFYIDPALTIYTRTVSTQPSVITVTTVNPQSFVNPYANVVNPFPRERVQPDEFDTYRYTRPVSGGVLDPNARTGYSQNWNLTIEQQLFRDLAVSAAYVGNLGVKILAARQLNPAIFGPGATTGNTLARRPIVGLSDVEIATPYQASNFHSFQLNVTKRTARGLTLLGTYVWSKVIDNSSSTVEGSGAWTRNSFNERLDRGPADFDVRHKANISFVYDIPSLVERNAVARALLNNWQINGIATLYTGLPFTVRSGTDRSLTAIGQDTADLVGDPTKPAGSDVTVWFNPQAFTQAALGTFGNVGRNSLRGPGFAVLDVAVFKNIPVTERLNLQFRAESFNTLNRTNFNNPSATVTAGGNFGRILSAADPRVIQFGIKAVF